MSAAAARADLVDDVTALDRPGKGFRPARRRRARIAGGSALAAVAIGGNVLVYASLDDRTEVLQVLTDVPAGHVVSADDLRVVEVDADPTVPLVPAADLALVDGQHAVVHIPSGALLSRVLVQPTPLVAPGSAVVAVELRPTLVPSGIRERSRIELVVTTGDQRFRTTGRAVTRPAEVDGVSGLVSMSVEVASDDAPRIAAGDEVRIVLLEPLDDPVYAGDAG